MICEINIDHDYKCHKYSFNEPTELSHVTRKNDTLYYADESKILNESIFHKGTPYKLDHGFNDEFGKSQQEKDTEQILDIGLELLKHKRLPPVDVVCYRGTLTKLGTMPYENLESTKLAAIRVAGTVFVWWFRSNCDEAPVEQRRSMYSGFRFERVMTSPEHELDKEPFLHEESALLAAYTELKSDYYKHRLYIVGEVDCKDSKGSHVELKCRLRRKPGLDFTTKRYCFLKWWLQSYLLGIDRVVVGYRDVGYGLEEVKDYQIGYFPRCVRNTRNSNEFWDPNICMSFIGHALHEMRGVMANFREEDICVIQFDPKTRNLMFSKDKAASGQSQFNFLSTSFVEQWKNAVSDSHI